MLYALNNNGMLQSVFHLNKKEIDVAKQKVFYCPVCRERLQIRSGRKIIPHFAHLPKSTCSYSRGGETAIHESGKWSLYQWLQQQGYSVDLEHYLPDIKQRPDIWLKIKDKQVAIEYQCASIPIREVLKRTIAYRKAGIFPLWILGTKHFQRAGPHQIILSEFTRAFLYYWSSSYHLFFYNPSLQQLTKVSNFKASADRKCMASFHTSSLKTLTFPQLFSSHSVLFSREQYLSQWENAWRINRTQYRNQVGSEERRYRQYLYLKGYHFSLIPTACYLPIQGAIQHGLRPYIWQVRLMCEHFMPLSIGSRVYFPQVEIPLTRNEFKPDLSLQYLELLTHLNIVEKTGDNRYIKKKHVNFHKRMEDGLEDDRNTMKQLKNLQRIFF